MRATTYLLACVCCLAVPACASDDSAIDPITSELELRDAMRVLWSDHVTWTRTYLISAIAELPDADAAAGRLLQNQDDIGNAIEPFYGVAAGNALAALLREHITIAVEVVVAAKAGDTAAFAAARARWTNNADEIATFLANANPSWPVEDLRTMMRMHLDQTVAEASARLTGDWAGDVQAYDEVTNHILHMADTLSAGIATQFPDLVASSASVSPRDQELHRGMRALWTDHVVWTRVYLISAIAELPDADAAAGRLLQNQGDIGNAIEPFYGVAAADALTVLLREHITIAVEIVAVAMAGQTEAMAAASTRWTANADAIATFLADANPNWPVDDLRTMMRMHLDQTLAEATARLTGDWAGDVVAYDEVADHILHMADALGDGIALQFPEHHPTSP